MTMFENVGAVQEDVRKLASVVQIDAILKHPNADKLELAMIGGWQVCVKLGDFKSGDLAIYCEIDSLVPLDNPLFAFLGERSSATKTVNEKQYSRISTIKLRKELSQGLLLPIPDDMWNSKIAGTNLTHALGVLKYDPVVKVPDPLAIKADGSLFYKLISFIRGAPEEVLQTNWPSHIPKTDEERVQNIHNAYQKAVEDKEEFEVTYKLEGSSMTVYQKPVGSDLESNIGICSRNAELIQHEIIWPWFRQFRVWISQLLLCLRRSFITRKVILPRWKRGVIPDNNEFIQTANSLRLKEKLFEAYSEHGYTLALQGELIGPGVRGNYENVPNRKFCVYGIWMLADRSQPDTRPFKLLPAEARDICMLLDIEYVPVADRFSLLPATIKDCLKLAEGNGAFDPSVQREGLVYKSNLRRDFSFKVVSNVYLLKNDG
jgi:hypothetical protein